VSAAKECQQIGVHAGRCRHAASHETRRRKPRFGKEVRHARLSIVAALTSLALAVQVPLSALAAGADFAPARNDDIARRCVTFSSVYDRQYSDPRTALDDNSVAEALRVCAQAAEVLPVRPFDYKPAALAWGPRGKTPRVPWRARRKDPTERRSGSAREGLGIA
jgi:hypothetical protein